MSLIFETALDEWRRVRADYSRFLESQHDAAETACAGVLLNARGRAAGVRAESLFLGPSSRAALYASEELHDFWATTPRMTFQTFERQSYEWDE
jgi:hypothetical protein